jgi:hypothetical protein
VARSVPAQKSATDAPRRIEGTVRVPSARSERSEPTVEALPASEPAPVNPFVQAVQDDIKEDEATRKKH